MIIEVRPKDNNGYEPKCQCCLLNAETTLSMDSVSKLKGKTTLSMDPIPVLKGKTVSFSLF